MGRSPATAARIAEGHQPSNPPIHQPSWFTHRIHPNANTPIATNTPTQLASRGATGRGSARYSIRSGSDMDPL